MSKPAPPEQEITALVGHKFPTGNYTIAHWENFLLTDCTGSPALPDGQAHPVALFHVPFLGTGTTIADLFALGQAESDLSILIESYDWEFHQPLREQTEYTISGEISEADRRHNASGQLYDRIQFRFDMKCENQLAASSTITWHFTRNTL
mgnify:CR=1 FL=1